MKKIKRSVLQICGHSLLLALALSFLSCLFGFWKIYTGDKSQDGETVYISLQQESNPFNIPLANYEKLYEKLTGSKDFSYYECYMQYLEGLPKEKSFFDYEDGTFKNGADTAQCVQVSQNLQSQVNLSCAEGRLFEEIDFEYANGTIPVLAGYGYQDSMSVGSEFTAAYLYQEYKFQVVGILSENAGIDTLDKNIDLDEYIVMPSFSLSAADEETDAMKIHYANKTSGVAICNREEFRENWKMIESFLSESECGEYTMNITPMRYNIQAKTGIGIVGWTVLLGILFVLIMGIYGIWNHRSRQTRAHAYMELAGCYLLSYGIYRIVLSQVYPKLTLALWIIFGIVFLIPLRYNKNAA